MKYIDGSYVSIPPSTSAANANETERRIYVFEFHFNDEVIHDAAAAVRAMASMASVGAARWQWRVHRHHRHLSENSRNQYVKNRKPIARKCFISSLCLHYYITLCNHLCPNLLPPAIYFYLMTKAFCEMSIIIRDCFFTWNYLSPFFVPAFILREEVGHFTFCMMAWRYELSITLDK